MITKTGDFRPGESRSDFDFTKVAEFTDGFFVADKENKNKLDESFVIEDVHGNKVNLSTDANRRRK